MSEYNDYWRAEQERQYQEQLQQNHLITEVHIPEVQTDRLEVTTNQFAVITPNDKVDSLIAHPAGCAILTAGKKGKGVAMIHIGALSETPVVSDLINRTKYRFQQKTGTPLNEANPKIYYASDMLVEQLDKLDQQGIISGVEVSTAETSTLVLSKNTGQISFE